MQSMRLRVELTTGGRFKINAFGPYRADAYFGCQQPNIVVFSTISIYLLIVRLEGVLFRIYFVNIVIYKIQLKIKNPLNSTW